MPLTRANKANEVRVKINLNLNYFNEKNEI